MEFSKKIIVAISLSCALVNCLPCCAQLVANNLAELRTYGLSVNNSTISLSPTGGDPHPVTGVVTPGTYWINGDHYTDPTNTTPIFMELNGTDNTYNLDGATIKLDTRKLDGFGRALGHGSGVEVIRIGGSNNTVNGITLIGEDLALDTDPDAQRYADWSAVYVYMSGDNNQVHDAFVESRGSSPYGVSDAFGKGNRVFPQGEPAGQVEGAEEGVVGLPWVGHNKTSAFLVRDATNAVVNNLELQVKSYGHGFFVQKAYNTTLTNSTVTGELVPATNVINHPKYQEYGFTSQGTEIPEDIMISANEDGVRAYGPIDGVGTVGLTIENVVVTNMRQAFATSVAQTDLDNGIGITLNNVEAYGNEVGFTPGTYTDITNAKGDITTGPLVWFQYNNTRDTNIDIELVGDVPVGLDYAAAYLNGQRLDVTIESNLELGHLPEDSLVRLGQTYFNNWRDNTTPTGPEDSDPGDFIDSVIVNNTNQMLVLGNLATNNTISSIAPIIPNGKENNPYDGISLVPSGSHITVSHIDGLGNNGTATDGTLETNASIVELGGMLELSPGIQINNEKLTISGIGIDGLGALYSDGDNLNATRFGSSSSTSESTIFLDGDASIGVGIAGNQMLIGSLQGTGNFTKRGAGILAMEKASTFDGSFTVAEGEVVARSNVVNNAFTVNAGASFTGIGDNALNTTNTVFIYGSVDINGRSDDNSLLAKVGALFGPGRIGASNSLATNHSELTIDTQSFGYYFGMIEEKISLIKEGANVQALAGNNTYTGTTTINEGTLQVLGNHSDGGDYFVNDGGTLGGTGVIVSSVMVNFGGTLSPGASAGILTVDAADFQSGSTFEIEIGGTTVGTQFDQLSAADLALGGTLEVSFLNAFKPDANDVFTIATSLNLSGEFENVANGERVDTAGGEGSFLVTYNSSTDTVVLSNFLIGGIILDGDYNDDGTVDAADYTLWRDNIGAAEGTLPNDPNSGDIGMAQYNTWVANYGATSDSGSSTAVPEPTSMVILLTATGLAICQTNTRRSVV